jgi:hypothetical protein
VTDGGVDQILRKIFKQIVQSLKTIYLLEIGDSKKSGGELVNEFQYKITSFWF